MFSPSRVARVIVDASARDDRRPMARTPPGSSTVGIRPSDGATTIVTRLARRSSRVAIASRRGQKNMRARVVSAHLVVDAANIMAVVVE
jgi:hypothetical protein